MTPSNRLRAFSQRHRSRETWHGDRSAPQPALPFVRLREHTWPMRQNREFKVDLKDLEHESRVAPEDRIESVDPTVVPLPDPRGAQPDRDWFAAGG